MDKMGAILADDRIRRLTEWQPIETAPKDGTVVDIWHIEEGRLIGYAWQSDEWSSTLTYKAEVSFGTEDISHWMPLPEPPKGE